jgi:hypothetical protein
MAAKTLEPRFIMLRKPYSKMKSGAALDNDTLYRKARSTLQCKAFSLGIEGEVIFDSISEQGLAHEVPVDSPRAAGGTGT